MAQTLILNNLADEVVERIEQLASINKLSLEEQAKQILKTGSGDNRRGLRESFQAIAALTPRNILQTDSVALIREDRDR